MEKATANPQGGAPTIEQVLQGGYSLQETNTISPKPATEIKVEVLDPLLGLLPRNGQSTLPTSLNTPHLDIPLYTLRGDDPNGSYIVVWKGKDGHQVEYRDLQPRRMVPVNVRPQLTPHAQATATKTPQSTLGVTPAPVPAVPTPVPEQSTVEAAVAAGERAAPSDVIEEAEPAAEVAR